MFNEHYGTGFLSNYTPERTTRPVAVTWRDNFEARYPEKHFLNRLAVRRAISTPTTHRCTHDQRASYITVHLWKLGRVVQNLVGAKRKKVTKHNLY